MGTLSARFRERMLEERKAKKINQDEIAKKLGVAQTMVSRYEKGSVPIDLDLAENIADALGVPVMTMICESAESTSAQIELRALIQECPDQLAKTLLGIVRPLVQSQAKTGKADTA